MSKNPWVDGSRQRDEQFRLKREVLLRTAAQAFNEAGFHKTSLNDLARRLNVTKPTLYYYIKGKDDILFECQRIALEQMHDAMEDVRSRQDSGLNKLKCLLKRYAEVVSDDYGRCLVITGIRALQPESREKLAHVRRTLNKAVHDLILQGIDDGSVKPCDPMLTTNALFGAFNWICHWHQPNSNYTPGEVAEYYLDLFTNGMAAGKTQQNNK